VLKTPKIPRACNYAIAQNLFACMKQTPAAAQPVKFRRKAEELRRKTEVLTRAKDYLRELLATAGTKEDGQFLRFALTRSLFEYELPLIQEMHRRNRQKTMPQAKIARVAEFSSKLVNALEAANDAYKLMSPGADALFVSEKIGHAADIRDSAHSLLRRFELKSRSGHPILEKRLYSIPALLTYLRWSKAASRADSHEPADAGMWAWLTKWDDHFGPIHVLDRDWLGRRLCAGDLLPEDFNDRKRFFVPLSKRGDTPHAETLLRSWSKVAKQKDYHDTITRAGAAFIAWRRRLFKKPMNVGDVGSTARLDGTESKFAASASKTLARHTRLTQRSILDSWSQIHL
jgi:hypothetical protein